jgi:hypothetical protein
MRSSIKLQLETLEPRETPSVMVSYPVGGTTNFDDFTGQPVNVPVQQADPIDPNP